MIHREELATFIPTTGRAVELGVARGLFSDALLAGQPGFTLVSIDSWADPDRSHNDEEFAQACALLGRWGARSEVLRKTFEEALADFPDGHFDLIYVDGYAHTGQQGGLTLRQWWPKLKIGGVFAGHDYDPVKWPSTVKAVDAFAAEHGLRLQVTTGDRYPSWFTFKQRQ